MDSRVDASDTKDREDRDQGKANHVPPRDPRPLVTVVTPAFAAEDFIEETMRSVWHQTHRPIEHLVIDDCSTDDTAARAEAMAQHLSRPDYRVDVVRLPQNLGTAGALNEGFSRAQGGYVAWLSADDLYTQATKTAVQLRMLERHPSTYGVFDWLSFHGPDAAHSRRQFPFGWPGAFRFSPRMWAMEPSATLLGLLFFNPINGTSILLRRNAVAGPGPFDPELGTFDQDGDLWLRMMAKGMPLRGRTQAGTMYRSHPGQNSRNSIPMEDGSAISRMRVIIALADLGLLGPLLDRRSRELWLAVASSVHMIRPTVCELLVDLGMASASRPSSRRALHALAGRLRDIRPARLERGPLQRERAHRLLGSEVFKDFIDSFATI